MEIRPHVRGELLLSKELLTRSEYRTESGSDDAIAHDVILADDSAEMAMGAICSQLGGPVHKRRVSISDYFAWLIRSGKTHTPVPGMDYFAELHRTRMDLQCRFVVPDLNKWHRVKENTLGFITRWCQEYLHVHVWNLQWELAGELANGGGDAASASSSAEVTDSVADQDALSAQPVSLEDEEAERRYSPRYECEGAAEIRVPAKGRLLRGRIVNVSLGGCYIETAAPLEVGTRVEVVLRVTGLAFRAAGEIRSVYGSAGVGVKFTGMSAGGRIRLQELIAELEESWFAAGMPNEEDG